MHHIPDEHDLGLAHDLQVVSGRIAERRRLLRGLLGGGTMLALAACVGDGEGAGLSDGTADSGGSTGGSGGSDGGSSSGCVAHPQETAGPYPSDGSNYAGGSLSNVLTQSGVVRPDIRGSFGLSQNVAPGVPLVLDVTLASTSSACAPLEGWAMYLWHCTRDGRYSLYSSGVLDENFLRGVQVSDASGRLRFITIFPGCYEGRYPHIHFELYRSLAAATGYQNRVLTSQMALPANVCSAVYAGAEGYGSSAAAYSRVSLARDNIFADNSAAQVAAQTPLISGSVDQGFTGSITVGVP